MIMDIDIELQHELSLFSTIDLAELDSLQLINRYDRKFIIPETELLSILSELSAEYSVLQINNNTILGYESDYLDTDDLQFYHAHHNGKSNRVKLRRRFYTATNDSYFEIKHKNNKNKTTKKRWKLDPNLPAFSDAIISELENPLLIDPATINNKLKVKYKRICLVSKSLPEKITIDTSLCFINGKTIPMPGIAIAEIKTPRPHTRSSFIEIMKHKRISQSSISKYCLGISLSRPDEKRNRFKKTIRSIDKITDALPENFKV